jgi:hypothetical protein
LGFAGGRRVPREFFDRLVEAVPSKAIKSA